MNMIPSDIDRRIRIHLVVSYGSIYVTGRLVKCKLEEWIFEGLYCAL